jgi:hypothetical protein
MVCLTFGSKRLFERLLCPSLRDAPTAESNQKVLLSMSRGKSAGATDKIHLWSAKMGRPGLATATSASDRDTPRRRVTIALALQCYNGRISAELLRNRKVQQVAFWMRASNSLELKVMLLIGC